VISKLSFRQVARATQYGPGIDVFSGNWIDDGDGVPDGDDLVGCTGGGYHNLALKAQANIPIRAAKRDLRERAGG
jgi:hypothetical protein